MITENQYFSKEFTPKINENLPTNQDDNSLFETILKGHSRPVDLRNDYLFSFNKSIINKPKVFPSDGNKFYATSGSRNELKSYIDKGFAWCPFLFKNNQRSKNNALRSSMLVFDVDNTKIELDSDGNEVKVYDPKLTLEQAQNNPLIKEYGVIETSPSHTEKCHRFRLIFFLPFDVDGVEYEQSLKLINPLINYAGDPAAMEAGRLFYGNDKAIWFNHDNPNLKTLPSGIIKLAEEKAEAVKKEAEEKRKQQLEKISLNVSKHSEIKEATLPLIKESPPRQKGNGNYHLLRNMVWSLCYIFTVGSGISPDNDNYNDELTRVELLLEDSPLQSNRSQGWNINKLIQSYDPTRTGTKGQIITSATFFECFNEVTGSNVEYKHLFKNDDFVVDPEYIKKIKDEQKNYYHSQVGKRVNADITEKARYCNYQTLKNALPDDFYGILKIVGLKSLGKSQMIGSYYYDETANMVLPDKESLKQDLKEKGYDVISLSTRQALCEEQATRWNLEFINSDNAREKYKKATESSDIALCIDSLPFLNNRDFGEKVAIIIDEIVSFRQYIYTSETLKDKRHLIIEMFEKLIKLAYERKWLFILLDADLSQDEIDIIQDISLKVNGAKFPTFGYENTFKPEPREFYLVEKEEDILKIGYQLASENKRLIWHIDSLEKANAVEQTLNDLFLDKKIININSESIADPYYRQFVTQPNETIRTEKPDILIHTDSMGMGVSIDVSGAFDYVLCLSGGISTPSGVRQNIWRYREFVPVVLHCPEKSYRYNPDIPLDVTKCHQQIQKLAEGSFKVSAYLQKNYHTTDNDYDFYQKMLSLFDKDKCLNDPHLKQLAKIYYQNNYEFLNYREVVLDQLRDYESWNINTDQDEILTKLGLLTPDNEITFHKDVKTRKSENKKVYAVNLSESNDITLEQAIELSKRSHLPPEQKMQVFKAFLKQKFGNLADDPNFCYFVSRDHGRNLNRVTFEFFASNLEASKFYDHKAWQDFQFKLSEGLPLITDVKKYSHCAKLLKNLRIFEFLSDYQEIVANINPNDPNTIYPTVENLIKPLRKRFLRYSKQIKDRFNLTVHKNTNITKFLGYLLNRFGYNLKVDNLTEIITIKNLSCTNLDGEGNLFDNFRLLIHQALLSKYEKDYQESQKHNPVSNAIENVILPQDATNKKIKNKEVTNFGIFDTPKLKSLDNEDLQPTVLTNRYIKKESERIEPEMSYNSIENEQTVTHLVDVDNLNVPDGFYDGDMNQTSHPQPSHENEPTPHPLTDLLTKGQKFITKTSKAIFTVLDIYKGELGVMVDAKREGAILPSTFTLANLIHGLKMEIVPT